LKHQAGQAGKRRVNPKLPLRQSDCMNRSPCRIHVRRAFGVG
jgi:hypothetical protein